jgi:hypothetical protein
VDDYAQSVGKGMRAAVVTLAATSGLVLAGTAAAATPRQIYADAADNGHLDRSYSKADLARANHDATIAGYGNQIIKITIKPKQKPVTQPAAEQIVKPKKPTPHQKFTPPKNAVPATAVAPPKGALPFTGAELGLFLAVGIALVAGGFLLRIMGRRSVDR